MIRIVILFFAFLFIGSCSQGYIVNMNENTQYPEGRDLFISKCNACHQLYSPESYNKAAWDSILVPMQGKAKLDDQQRNAIFNWIIEIKTDRDKKVQLN